MAYRIKIHKALQTHYVEKQNHVIN